MKRGEHRQIGHNSWHAILHDVPGIYLVEAEIEVCARGRDVKCARDKLAFSHIQTSEDGRDMHYLVVDHWRSLLFFKPDYVYRIQQSDYERDAKNLHTFMHTILGVAHIHQWRRLDVRVGVACYTAHNTLSSTSSRLGQVSHIHPTLITL